MSDECEACPAKGYCLGWPMFCEWAAESPPGEARLRHIRGRSRIAAEPAGDGAAAEYPPLLEQAANLAGAFGRAASAVVHGQPVKVSNDVYMERSRICMPCEFNGQRPYGVRCTKCGCTGAKLLLATERCPIGKWEAISPPASPANTGD